MNHRDTINIMAFKRNRPSLLTAFLALAGLVVLARHADAAELPRQVYSLLQRTCLECHGRQQHKGKLRLDTREFAIKGGRHGKVIVPGNAEASELYQRIRAARDSSEIMPPRGEPFSAAQVQLIRDWINQGAP